MTAPSILSLTPHHLTRWVILMLGILFVRTWLPAQSISTDPSVGSSSAAKDSSDQEKERPNQFDVFKINVGQFAINEARLHYEMQIGPATSIEFGVGYIYPNSFWFERSSEAVLASGFGLYASFRKYRILNRYFSTPAFRPYFSPTVFYRNSSYQDEWFLFAGSTPELSECGRYSQTFHQIGTAVRFGWQTTQGRLVADLYAGLGVKFISSRLTQTAINRESDVCDVIDITDFTVINEDIFDTNIIVQAGVKFGIRRNNRDRTYKNRENQTAPEEDTSPPIYQP